MIHHPASVQVSNKIAASIAATASAISARRSHFQSLADRLGHQVLHSRPIRGVPGRRSGNLAGAISTACA